jgi:protein-arginine kinase activator protein McsA
MSNPYEKHPKYCEQCKTLTPHLVIEQQPNHSDQQSQASTFSVAGIIEMITSMLSPADDTPLDYLQEESQFRCEKCGTSSKHTL